MLDDLISWACATQIDIIPGVPVPRTIEDILDFLDLQTIDLTDTDGWEAN